MSIELLIDSRNGTFIPQLFFKNFDMALWNNIPKDAEILNNYQNDRYWDVWTEILDNAYFLDKDNKKWQLWQDGDLWVYCYDSMSKQEIKNFFGDD